MPTFFSISGISEDNFLNIYNNNVADILFESDVIEQPKFMRVIVDRGSESATFDVTYFLDSPGEFPFRFNFEEVFKSLMSNQSNSDLGAPSVIGSDSFDYNGDLLNSYDVRYLIKYQEPEDDVWYDYTYKAFKSVEQIGETIVKPITDPYLLSQDNLTFFKGYPFDFSIYSNSSIALTNLNTGVFLLDGSVTTGVNRVYLSRGKLLLDELDQEWGFINRVQTTGGELIENYCVIYDVEPILRTGYNDLQINLGSFDPKLLKIKLIEPCDGVYLKWFNEKGSWSYWLFNSVYKDIINSKVNDIYNTDFESIDETFHPYLITGKEAKNTLQLKYDGLDNNEYNQIKSILTSPRVELFIGNINDDFSRTVANGGADYEKSWMSVRVLDGSITKNTKRDLHNITISIDKKKYTQS